MPPKQRGFSELLVSPSSKASTSDFLDVLGRAGLPCITWLSLSGDCLVHFKNEDGRDPATVARDLKKNIHALSGGPIVVEDQRLIGDVFVNESFVIEHDVGIGEWARPAGSMKPHVFNDPHLNDQIQLIGLDAKLAWEGVNAKAPVIVAVLDDGVLIGHEDLKDKLECGIAIGCDPQIANCDGSPTLPEDIHGTKVAGVIAAEQNNGIGIVGAAWNARLIPINIGVRGGSDVTASCGVEIAVRRGATVINASWWHRVPLLGLKNTLLALARSHPEVVFVAGAGSGGEEITPRYPSYPLLHKLSNVIGVAGHLNKDDPLDSSKFSTTYVHIAAPAYTFTTRDCQTGMCYGPEKGNTSYATAYVSSSIAHLKSRYPDWRAGWLKWRVMKSAIVSSPLKKKSASGGRLNFGTAMYPVFTDPAKIRRTKQVKIVWGNGLHADVCTRVTVEARLGDAGTFGAYMPVAISIPHDGDETIVANGLPGGDATQIQFRVTCSDGRQGDAESPAIELIS